MAQVISIRQGKDSYLLIGKQMIFSLVNDSVPELPVACALCICFQPGICIQNILFQRRNFTHGSHAPAWPNSWICNATEWQHSLDHEGLQKLDQCCPIVIQGQPQRCTTLVISDFLVAILEKEKETGEINMNDVFNPIYPSYCYFKSN